MALKTRIVLALPALALALSACGGEQKQPEYETGQKDLIVETPNPSDVPVNLPTTPMTNAAATPADASAASTGAPK